MTPQEYLAIERPAERKSDYCQGEMFLKPHVSRRQNVISVNLTVALRSRLSGSPYALYSRALRCWDPTGCFCGYPDVMVLTEPEETFVDDPDSVTNPAVVIEVLESFSDGGLDHAARFSQYLQLPSLREHVTVLASEVYVHHLILDAPENAARRYQSLDDVLELPAIACAIPLREIYALTELAS